MKIKDPALRKISAAVSFLLTVFLLFNIPTLFPDREVGVIYAASSLCLFIFLLATSVNNVDRIMGKRKHLFLGISLSMILVSMIAGYFGPIKPPVDEYNMLIQALCGMALFIMAGIDLLDSGYVLRMRKM